MTKPALLSGIKLLTEAAEEIPALPTAAGIKLMALLLTEAAMFM